MKKIPIFLKAPFRELVDNWQMVREMTKREILGRYRGSGFGLWWSLLSPFMMLFVYTFAFGTVMGGRWQESGAEGVSFSIVLFSGLIVHGFFAECFGRAPMLILGNLNLVKKVVFPLGVLPWPLIASALFHALMNVFVFVVLRGFLDRDFDWMIIFLPVVWMPLVFLVLGVVWVFASLGVYFRDLVQVTGVVVMGVLFLSSAIVPLSAIPEGYRWIYKMNPLTFIIDQSRDVMIFGVAPDWLGLGAYSLVSIVIFYFGYAWFSFSRRGFADVL